MESQFFDKEYRVHVYETGPDGKLNLFSLFNYLQDIASDHAVFLGFGRDDLMRDNRFWVLSRMYAEIKEWPVWEDKIIVRTWPNGTHIASGTSSWLILDQTTRRVQRPDTVLARFQPNLNLADSPLRYATKIDPAAETGNETPPFRVKVSDIDVNLHTNNVQYLKWACDTYGIDFVMKNIPKSAEINYLAESVFDEEITIQTSSGQENGLDYIHSVFRTDGRKELCRIRIEWIEGNVN